MKIKKNEYIKVHHTINNNELVTPTPPPAGPEKGGEEGQHGPPPPLGAQQAVEQWPQNRLAHQLHLSGQGH